MKYTIVGAGPVGTLLSIQLARRDFEVELLERREDLRKNTAQEGRSINLALSTRGLFALNEIGLDSTVLTKAIPMTGREIHSLDETLTFQPYGKDDSECIYSVSRAELNRLLLDEASRLPKINIEFSSKVIAFEPTTNEITVEKPSGEIKPRKTSILIGSDGSSSAIRKSMHSLPGYTHSEIPLNYGYKEIELPAGPNQSFLMNQNALHIWPRGNFMLIALPNQNGSFTCTLFLPFEGKDSFSTLNRPEDVQQFFEKHFRFPAKHISDLSEQFFSHATGNMITVKCSPWNIENRTLLIGDAAHAIVPFFGQGMNCGFEDVTYLCQELAPENSPDFTKFSQNRKSETDAIADMAVENFIEMRDKVGQKEFLLEKEVEKILQKEFPQQYISRYSLVTFSRVPYRTAKKIVEIEDGILRKLCKDITRASDVDRIKAKDLITKELLWLLS